MIKPFRSRVRASPVAHVAKQVAPLWCLAIFMMGSLHFPACILGCEHSVFQRPHGLKPVALLSPSNSCCLHPVHAARARTFHAPIARDAQCPHQFMTALTFLRAKPFSRPRKDRPHERIALDMLRYYSSSGEMRRSPAPALTHYPAIGSRHSRPSYPPELPRNSDYPIIRIDTVMSSIKLWLLPVSAGASSSTENYTT